MGQETGLRVTLLSDTGPSGSGTLACVRELTNLPG